MEGLAALRLQRHEVPAARAVVLIIARRPDRWSEF